MLAISQLFIALQVMLLDVHPSLVITITNDFSVSSSQIKVISSGCSSHYRLFLSCSSWLQVISLAVHYNSMLFLSCSSHYRLFLWLFLTLQVISLAVPHITGYFSGCSSHYRLFLSCSSWLQVIYLAVHYNSMLFLSCSSHFRLFLSCSSYYRSILWLFITITTCFSAVIGYFVIAVTGFLGSSLDLVQVVSQFVTFYCLMIM